MSMIPFLIRLKTKFIPMDSDVNRLVDTYFDTIISDEFSAEWHEMNILRGHYMARIGLTTNDL